MLVDLRLTLLLLFNLYELLVILYALTQLRQQINKSNDLDLVQLVDLLVQLPLCRVEYFHGCTESGDLNFAVETAFVTADAVEDAGDIVELSLDLLE